MSEQGFLIDADIEHYCERHSGAEDALLEQLVRETNLKVYMPNMLSGKIQGRLLTMLVEIVQPKNILELGTFTGYSAICMARALPENALLTTIDSNPEIEDLARKYFKLSGLEEKIRFIIGDALTVVPNLDTTFDMAFIDADKELLSDYYQLVMAKMNAGGVIIVDNTLWYGKVADPQQNDRITQKIRQFNDLVQNDDRVSNVMLPLCDGVMIITLVKKNHRNL
jgi:predicted O-methyltransferase YrrM